MKRTMLTCAMLVLVLTGCSAFPFQNTTQQQQPATPPLMSEETAAIVNNKKPTPLLPADVTAEQIKKLLPAKAENIRIFPGDFDGNGRSDVSVLYELNDVVLNDSGYRGDKQYLDTYLQQTDNSFIKKRTDEGFPYMSWGIEDPEIADLNNDGRDEILVVKIQAGTGRYKSNYVMSFKNNALIDVPIEQRPYDEKIGGGRSRLFIENNTLKQREIAFTENDPNCCPSGPQIMTTWKFSNGKLLVSGQTVDYDYDDTRSRPTYIDEVRGFSFAYAPMAFAADFSIESVLTVNDYADVSPPGPGAFYAEALKGRWQNRLAHKNTYTLGDMCLPEDMQPITDYAQSEVSCNIFSLTPNFVMQYTDPDGTDYIVVTDSLELVFSVQQPMPLAFNVINNTLTFDR